MMPTILVTGGAGFVGANLAIKIKQNNPMQRVIAVDNLKRRGSELNLSRLSENGVEFLHGDVRNREDLFTVGKIDCLIECSAEPSVLAGGDGACDYVINTNLLGTINCLELARKWDAAFIFLSTSRVYPIAKINAIPFRTAKTRFEWVEGQHIPGFSPLGISEEFSLEGARSLYGATKLASELIIQEYGMMYGLRAVINRCGVITGPWQMGKIDQGVVALWVAKHIYREDLSYIGFGCEGMQVRDLLHIDDLYRLIHMQLSDLASHAGEIYNVGGGRDVSLSLKELTAICQEYTGETVPISPVSENRQGDVRIYMTDHTKVTVKTGWNPQIMPDQMIREIVQWIRENQEILSPVLT